MILDKIFLQYQKKIRRSFASLWMDLHGKLFMGSPNRADIPVRDERTAKELVDTYYYDSGDRILNLHKMDADDWLRGQTFLSQLRDAQEPLISKRLFWIGCVLSIVLMIAASMMGAVSGKVEDWTSDWKQERAEAKAVKAEEKAQARAKSDVAKAASFSASQCESHIKSELKKDLNATAEATLASVQSICMENHKEAIEASIAKQLSTLGKCEKFENDYKFYDGKYWDALIAQCQGL